MTDAMRVAPMHPRKEMERFTEMRKNDNYQTYCSDQL